MTITNIDRLDLNTLGEGRYCFTQSVGLAMVEACIVCLADQSHTSGVIVLLEGVVEQELPLLWDGTVTDTMRRAWGNRPKTTQWAAHGIALLLIEEVMGYTVLERISRKDGFNYWLGDVTDNMVSAERKARLIVSGLRQASRGQVAARIRHGQESSK